MLQPIHISSINSAAIKAVADMQVSLQAVAGLDGVPEGQERHIAALRFSPDHSKLLATSASPQLHTFNLNNTQQAPPMSPVKTGRHTGMREAACSVEHPLTCYSPTAASHARGNFGVVTDPDNRMCGAQHAPAANAKAFPGRMQ